MGKKISSSNMLVIKQIKDKLNKEENDIQELFEHIFKISSKIIAPESDLYDLYHYGGMSFEELDTLVNFVNGGYIKVPTKTEWRECLFLTFSYILRNIEGVDNWNDIKEKINLPKDWVNKNKNISLGLRHKDINRVLYKELKNSLHNLTNKSVVKNLHKSFEKFEEKDEEEGNG